MEVKTCEEYVLNKLTETEEELYKAQENYGELQRILFTVQGALELSINDDGSLRIDVDEYASSDTATRNFLVKLLGRGKYKYEETDPDTDVDEDVDTDVSEEA